MAHEVETLFYAGAVPWHGLGTQVEKALTSEEAIVKAGLDWEVKVGNLFGPNRIKVDDKLAIYRVTDGKVLGICTERYAPFQNHEAFSFLDSLVQDGVLKYEVAGSLRGGRRIFMVARLTEEMEVNGEKHIPYILLHTSHDLETSIRIMPTTVRVVCMNTLQAAIATGGAGGIPGIRIVHMPALQRRLDEAKHLLQVTTEANRRMVEFLEKAGTVKVNKKTYTVVQTELFGSLDDKTPAQRKEAIEKFLAIYQAEVKANGANAYSLANAVTGYADHGLRYNGEDGLEKSERRLLGSVEGGRALTFKSKGFTAVRSLVRAG